MAHLIPILQDIIPIFRRGEVKVVKSTELHDATGQTEGMIRKGAIVGMSDHICSSVMIAKPHSASAVHHHGEQDTIVYAAAGYGCIVTNPSLVPSSELPTPAASSSTAQAVTQDERTSDLASTTNSTSKAPGSVSSLPSADPDDPSASMQVLPPVDPNTDSALPPQAASPPSEHPINPPPSVLDRGFPTGAPDVSPGKEKGSTGKGKSEKGLHYHPLSPGDFALIPAWTEHQEVNESDGDVVWIIHRAPGGTPVVVNLEGWGGGEVKS